MVDRGYLLELNELAADVLEGLELALLAEEAGALCGLRLADADPTTAGVLLAELHQALRRDWTGLAFATVAFAHEHRPDVAGTVLALARSGELLAAAQVALRGRLGRR